MCSNGSKRNGYRYIMQVREMFLITNVTPVCCLVKVNGKTVGKEGWSGWVMMAGCGHTSYRLILPFAWHSKQSSANGGNDTS